MFVIILRPFDRYNLFWNPLFPIRKQLLQNYIYIASILCCAERVDKISNTMHKRLHFFLVSGNGCRHKNTHLRVYYYQYHTTQYATASLKSLQKKNCICAAATVCMLGVFRRKCFPLNRLLVFWLWGKC